MFFSVRVPESGVCVHISDEEYAWYVCDVLYAVMYVHRACFVVCGCTVSMRYKYGCSSDLSSVGNTELHHLKLRGVCIHGRSYVGCSECYVVFNERDEPATDSR